MKIYEMERGTGKTFKKKVDYMKIINLDRGQGKTTELVKISNKEWKYIVCKNQQRLDIIMDVAEKLGLDIPFPITIKELPLKSRFIESVLIDDIEDVLSTLIGKQVDVITTSGELLKEWFYRNEATIWGWMI